jgi:acetylornithine deacetylase/succinyl-diaminopimelate desuccinylase-like protein
VNRARVAETVAPSEEAIVAFARDLVAIPTENPPGAAYDECVERIAVELGTLGIGYELVDTGEDDAREERSSPASVTAGRSSTCMATTTWCRPSRPTSFSRALSTAA